MTYVIDMGEAGEWPFAPTEVQVWCDVCHKQVLPEKGYVRPDAISLRSHRIDKQFCSRTCLEKWLWKRKMRI